MKLLSKLILRPLQWLLEIVLLLALILLVGSFALLFITDPQIRSFPLVVSLKQFVDPLIALAGSWIGVRWPGAAWGSKLLPLGMAAVVWGFRVIVVDALKDYRFRVEVGEVIAPPSTRGKRLKPISIESAVPAPSPGISALGTNGPLSALGVAQHPTSHIGRYEMLEEIGRGSMGRIYKARDPQIGRTVAIKMIPTHDLPLDQIGPQKERFAREAQAAGKMSHPGIVTVYDVVEDVSGNPCLVMEYVEGATLNDLLSPSQPRNGAGALSFEDRLRIAIQVAEALDYAHRKGVVHRDIKPANIMITKGGSAAGEKNEVQAKIADFGIAKLIDIKGTIGGGVMGTPSFISPEQITGGAVDARSDIFSFGVVLYFMFTGEKPFQGDSFTAVTFQVVHTVPKPARQINFALPEQLDEILLRCLAKNPKDRYASAAELVADLVALRDSRSSART